MLGGQNLGAQGVGNVLEAWELPSVLEGEVSGLRVYTSRPKVGNMQGGRVLLSFLSSLGFGVVIIIVILKAIAIIIIVVAIITIVVEITIIATIGGC